MDEKNPIQQVDLDRLKVLNSLFPTELKFSSDLQQLILDFVFPRIVWRYMKGGKIYWIRLGVMMANDLYFYEIRTYNEGYMEVLSTFGIKKTKLAKEIFEVLFHQIKKGCEGIYLSNIQYSYNYKIFSRYVFSYKDAKTYKVECHYQQNGSDGLTIHTINLDNKKEIRLVGTYKEWDLAFKKANECRALIEKRGGIAFSFFKNDEQRINSSADDDVEYLNLPERTPDDDEYEKCPSEEYLF